MKTTKEAKLTDNMDGFKIKETNYNDYEVSFRRWLISQIDCGNMSFQTARERFNLDPQNSTRILKKWQERYSEDFHVSLSIMNSKERADNKALQKRIKELEKQLEKAQMKNVALNTLIDVAETQFKLPIRKKPGSKQ